MTGAAAHGEETRRQNNATTFLMRETVSYDPHIVMNPFASPTVIGADIVTPENRLIYADAKKRINFVREKVK